MGRLVKHTDIRQVEASWKKLHSENKHLSVYQEYAFCRVVGRFSSIATKQRCKNVIYELRDHEDQTILLVPLHLCKMSERTEAYLWGEFSQAGYLDCIYSDRITPAAFREALEAIAQDIGNLVYILSRVPSTSRLNDLITGSLTAAEFVRKEWPCVRIDFADDFEGYLGQLSKQTRQNLRTSVNRLAKGNLTCSVRIFIDQPIPLLLLQRMFRLYWRRLSEKRIQLRLRRFIPYSIRNLLNPAIIALNRLPNVFYSIISIDQKMAGFCAGFTSAEGSTSIPFLAIDSRFSQYSPGGLLITETIRQLINQGQVTSLDLARGDEQYKFTYGGAEHTNYSYDIALALPGQ